MKDELFCLCMRQDNFLEVKDRLKDGLFEDFTFIQINKIESVVGKEKGIFIICK